MRHLAYQELDQLSKLQHQSRLTGPALLELFDSQNLASAEVLEVHFSAHASNPEIVALPTHSFSGRSL